MTKLSKPVRRLVSLGVCSPADIEDAAAEAEKLSSPEALGRVREIERLFRTMGDSNRIKILLLLSKREMCICEIEFALKLPQPTVSHHMAFLERAGLVVRNKRARWAFYRVRESPLLSSMMEVISLGS